MGNMGKNHISALCSKKDADWFFRLSASQVSCITRHGNYRQDKRDNSNEQIIFLHLTIPLGFGQTV